MIGWLFLFLSCVTYATVDAPFSPSWKTQINHVISQTLTRYHYVDQSINDEFSARVFDLMLKRIDPNKRFFTQMDIDRLNDYKYRIDNDIRSGQFSFYEYITLLLTNQIDFVASTYESFLADTVNLNQPGMIEFELDSRPYVADKPELMRRWQTSIQYHLAQNYLSLYKETNPSGNTLVVDAEIERLAREKTKRELDRRFDRLKSKSSNDHFIQYLSAITEAFGPHTSYLPPDDKADFDINMSGQLEGIGAVLKEENGYIKVTRVVPGSASWRQGELAVEDIILSVSQDVNDEPVSIIETPVQDAVRLIRGPKDTPVTLTIKKPNGIIKTISITRDIVIIQSTYAKFGVFNRGNESFGYVNLPSFYRDFDNTNNRNAADDVRRALTQFNASDTDGMILDLRSNGGGSLKDAVDISGFFIDSGPVVQVSNYYAQKTVYVDNDPSVIYEKPLIVLVNKFSASASEIVSAALQDYDRAIIMGGPHTFGKGTVQKVVDLDAMIAFRDPPFGFLKVTIQEYFRITGVSTQFNGVTPDIIYPTTIDYVDSGEKNLTFAFKGSQTSAADYTPWEASSPSGISDVIQRSRDRISAATTPRGIAQYNDFMKAINDRSKRSIRIDDIWSMQQTIKKKNRELDDQSGDAMVAEYTNIEPVLDDTDEDEKKTHATWVTELTSDTMIGEALNILTDLITLMPSKQPDDNGDYLP